MNNWYLRNGLVYHNNQLEQLDVLILNGEIVSMGKEAQQLSVSSPNIQEVDVAKCVVSRGFVDMHVHLREPGFTSKETIASGTSAAAAGGFTTVCAMPNTEPPLDSVDKLTDLRKRVAEAAVVHVLEIACLTKNRAGSELVDLRALADAGVKLFSDDGDPLPTHLGQEALQQLSPTGGVLINHLEDKEYVTEGLFSAAISPESEYRMLERDLELVAKTKGRYHAAHLSCFQSVDLIKEAKEQGLSVTAEVTPHHLIFTAQDIREPHGNFQMKPPLREDFDRQVLLDAIQTGVIDVVATDHAPHGKEKLGPIQPNSPFGVTGLETAFPALYTHLVKPGYLTLERLLHSLTQAPAAIIDTHRELAVGVRGDVVVLDLASSRTVSPEQFRSKGWNSPFIGERLHGWPILTLVDGEERYSCQASEHLHWIRRG